MGQVFEQLILVSGRIEKIERLLAEFTREARERDQLMKTLLASYEREMSQVHDTASAIQLSSEQTAPLVRELKILEGICNVGVWSNKVLHVSELITP